MSVLKIPQREDAEPLPTASADDARGRGIDIPHLGGTSAHMQQVRQQIALVAPTDCTVLVTGETGTGKGLAARAIHHLSRRRNGRFVHIDCAALSPTIIESELFGHERGAFRRS